MTPTWSRSGTRRSISAADRSRSSRGCCAPAPSASGVTDIEAYPTELDSLQALLKLAEPGDVVGLMCHAERQQVYDWLAAQGATADSPEQLREKVRRAAGRD